MRLEVTFRFVGYFGKIRVFLETPRDPRGKKKKMYDDLTASDTVKR